jgi:DNA-binding transcriptional MerR regulator
MVQFTFFLLNQGFDKCIVSSILIICEQKQFGMVFQENNVVREQIFTIKELESFSGIKAHTIRIWEQRYNLLQPERTDTNIRRYTDTDLKKLLNISLLLNTGVKISAVAKMDDQEMRDAILKSQLKTDNEFHHLHILKIAMLNYDEPLFNSVIDPHIEKFGLEKTFVEICIPFLHTIGIMWQADSICPAQEHFISCLLRQKLFAHIESQKNVPLSQDKTFVLYLPELEIHEISLIMLQFLLRQKGYKTIFLGQSVPIDDLVQIHQRMGAVDYISIFTTNPLPLFLGDYFKKISNLFSDKNCHFHFTGGLLKGVKTPDFQTITIYHTIEDFLQSV